MPILVCVPRGRWHHVDRAIYESPGPAVPPIRDSVRVGDDER